MNKDKNEFAYLQCLKTIQWLYSLEHIKIVIIQYIIFLYIDITSSLNFAL
jgi:hypothetical protein